MSTQPTSSSLKRKPPTDPPDFDRISSEQTTQITDNHTQQHASIKQMSALYEQTYIDTTAEIKQLLQYYAVVLAADANPDANSVNNADANSVTAQDSKTELKAILGDLAAKPELLEMEDMRAVLMDCGIGVDVKKGQNGERVVDVRLL